MAKKYGKRRKSGAGEPRDLFGAPPPPRPAPTRPASSTPLADYLSANWPGVNEGYVVLPRSLAEGMSLPWQQQMAAMLSQFHQSHRGLNWPVYRVVPSRYENLVDLDEEQLAEAGYLVEIDADGEMIYRERSGRKVADPQSTTVLVSCLDPIPPRGSARAAEAAAAEPERPRAAPMIIPPAPVWRTTPTLPEAEVPPLPESPRQPELQVTPSQPEGRDVRDVRDVTVSSPAEPAQPAESAESAEHGGAADEATPPRGIPVSGRDWFVPLPGEESSDDPADFGPTGDPTELPYRYRP
ncbi:MAG TPA: hypothetical protein VJ870_07745 [Amycolatopsis sp.]|nr:hypothetical protein [Amycolatopsis sp.]